MEVFFSTDLHTKKKGRNDQRALKPQYPKMHRTIRLWVNGSMSNAINVARLNVFITGMEKKNPETKFLLLSRVMIYFVVDSTDSVNAQERHNEWLPFVFFFCDTQRR